MSGITGIFRRDGRDVDPDQINKMNNMLAHRGPDGLRIWCEGPVAFGHQMLHTTSESLYEELPFEDEDSGLVITADARIDNRTELAKKLGVEDNKYNPDSYFILKAYEKWGENCPEELIGDFAFAIWDKSREKLFCVRDHMGIKTLFYYLSDDAFYFTTEIKALFTIPDIPRKLNELKVAIHLMNVHEDKKFTFYDQIFPLNSSSYVTVGTDKTEYGKYWKLDPSSKIVMASEEEYTNSFLEIFEEAIRCRLRSAFPIGFNLSGGLDSSSIVCMAKKILNKSNPYPTKINTFSFVFDDFKQCDERYYIQKVIDKGAIEPFFMKGDNILPTQRIKDILFYLNRPFLSPNLSLLFNYHENIRNKNIRVLFCGDPGDAVVSYGQKYLIDLTTTLHWHQLIKEINGMSEKYEIPKTKIFKEEIIIPFIPYFFKKIYRNYNKESYLNIMNPEFSNRTNFWNYYLESSLKYKDQANNSKKYHYYSLCHYSFQYYYEIKDSVNAAFSMEGRYPFFDKRLIEFCYALPTKMKVKLGWDRYILRKSMEGILPKEVQWRSMSTKTDFDPIYQKNLVGEHKLLEEITMDSEGIIGRFVDLDHYKDIYADYCVDGKSGSKQLWLVATLYLWLKNQEFV